MVIIKVSLKSEPPGLKLQPGAREPTVEARTRQPDDVVVKLVVGRHGQQSPDTDTQGVEDLRGRVVPHL